MCVCVDIFFKPPVIKTKTCFLGIGQKKKKKLCLLGNQQAETTKIFFTTYSSTHNQKNYILALITAYILAGIDCMYFYVIGHLNKNK